MKDIILWIWQLPQNVLGLLIILFTRAIEYTDESLKITFYYIVSDGNHFGISLGNYIIIKRPTKNSIKHEHGHQKQSKMLGPFYLFIIGIPSILMAILSILSYKYSSGKFAKNYYNRWPENWADKLGNVERSK